MAALMFSQRNDPYCDLLSFYTTNIVIYFKYYKNIF